MTEEIADAVFAHDRDPVIVSDLESRIIEVNPACERLFGWSRADLIGHAVGEVLYPPNMRGAASAAVNNAMARGSDRYLRAPIHTIYVDSEGARIPVEVTLSRVHLDGEPVLLRFIRDERTGPDIGHLAQSERRFRKIMQSSHELVSLVRPDGDWILSTLGGPLGFPPGYMPPAGILSLVHPDDYLLAEAALEELAATDPLGGTAGSIELRVRTVDGNYLWLENTGVNLMGDPDVGALVLQSRDVTARHEADLTLVASTERLQESSRQLQSVLSVFPAGVWLEDENHKLVMVNQVHCDLFGIAFEPEELVGIDVEIVTTEHSDSFEDGEAALARRREVMAAGVPDLDVEVELADGKIVVRDYVPLYSGSHVRGHLWIYRDITERKQLEVDQARARHQLEEQNQSLLELDRLKTELVATVSHELRTPLTSIISFADLLLDGEGVDEADRDRFTQIISNNAHRLLLVVGDLLLLGRAEAGNLRLDPEDIEVPALVDEVVAALEPTADSADLTIEVTQGAGPPIHADAARLDQVLDNLVSNAIKFTPPGGNIWVNAAFAGKVWCITVTDTGMGIPPADQALIFERFQRASNATTTPGTGLGLAVAKTLVEMHGGTIELESEPGVGTTVTVTLPLDAETTATDATAASTTGNAPGETEGP